MYTTQTNRQREREIIKQRGGGGSYRQVDVYNINQQIERERQLDEEDKVATDRCIQHSIIDRERQLDREEEEDTDRQMYVTQNNR